MTTAQEQALKELQDEYAEFCTQNLGLHYHNEAYWETVVLHEGLGRIIVLCRDGFQGLERQTENLFLYIIDEKGVKTKMVPTREEMPTPQDPPCENIPQPSPS